MFTVEQTVDDDYQDDIGKILKEVISIPTWTKMKKQLMDEALLLMAKKYISFEASYGYYFMSSVGDSYLYNVPMNKTGHLKKFRGQKIRIVCALSGPRWKRTFMAGPV